MVLNIFMVDNIMGLQPMTQQLDCVLHRSPNKPVTNGPFGGGRSGQFLLLQQSGRCQNKTNAFVLPSSSIFSFIRHI